MKQQPVPFSTPGRWSITTVDGTVHAGFLPTWAEDDPSEVDVSAELLPHRLAGISHRTLFEGLVVNIASPYTRGETGDDVAVFEGSINCRPYAPEPASQVPVLDIEIFPGNWLVDLDPPALAALAAQLHVHADRLGHDLHSALVAARDDWAAHHPHQTRTAARPASDEQPFPQPGGAL